MSVYAGNDGSTIDAVARMHGYTFSNDANAYWVARICGQNEGQYYGQMIHALARDELRRYRRAGASFPYVNFIETVEDFIDTWQYSVSDKLIHCLHVEGTPTFSVLVALKIDGVDCCFDESTCVIQWGHSGLERVSNEDECISCLNRIFARGRVARQPQVTIQSFVPDGPELSKLVAQLLRSATAVGGPDALLRDTKKTSEQLALALERAAMREAQRQLEAYAPRF